MIQHNGHAQASKLAPHAAHNFSAFTAAHLDGGPARRNLPGKLSPSELEQRFSFQTYSEDREFELHTTSAERRALLDKRLLEEVYEQLCTENGLDTKNLRLDAHDGVVTLDGTVTDRAMKARLGHFIRRCRFVKSVVNRMRIAPSAGAASPWGAAHALDDMAA